LGGELHSRLSPSGTGVVLSILEFTLGATAGPVNLGGDISMTFLPYYGFTWVGVFNVGVNF
jgi:hypothetical protein